MLLKKFESLPKTQSNDDISEIAKDVLKECIKVDVTEFNDEEIIQKLNSITKIQGKAAIGELQKKEIGICQ